ncbi:hypothetical protein MNBD_IGNAVI01-2095 [hydrothermal vent metagenome]|uniref:Uncharacterized protein n=1 Tax=hydrothermal vent metagenome TaxID=652676 RepID=A0A3B1CFC1_9ZZZZ
MWRIGNIILMLGIFLLLVTCKSGRKNTIDLRLELSKTLLTLDDALIDRQIKDKNDENYGAIKCAHCNVLHTRAAEAVYPFVVAYKITNDDKYLHAAITVGSWLIAQQEKNGSWKETPEEWTGTTTDQLLMLVLAYPTVKGNLSDGEQAKWMRSIKSAADYLYEVMKPEFASINYVATTAATLSSAYKLLNDEKYLAKAKELAHRTVSKMDEDGFIMGEGGRVLGNKYGVDLGYDMEMSLWGLGYYAKLTKDTLVNNYVRKALKNHIYFIYPDGSLDNSWGIRSNKWTNYGSATSDGLYALMSLYDNEEPMYANASLKNLLYLRKNMKDGIIGYGILYWDIFDTPPCIYPTFAKAKNIAMAYELETTDKREARTIPTEKIGWMKYFKTLDLVEVRTKNIMATITAYRYKDIKKGYKRKYMFRPDGGSISNLWVEGHGYLQAGSQTEYHRWEPMSFPEAEGIKCLTPRIELNTENGYFTNLFEFDGRIETRKKSDNSFVVTTVGELKDKKWQPVGIGYLLSHTFTNNSVEKTITLRYHDLLDTVRIVEPIINYPGMEFKLINDKTVEIRSNDKNFIFELINGDAKLVIGKDADKYWSVYPALRAFPIELIVKPPEKGFLKRIKYELRIIE